MQDKGFQPACLFQWLDLIADMTDEIEIEVLQHGGNHHENHVRSHRGKGQMRPSEVIVLYVEVLFARSSLIVECNDVLLGRCQLLCRVETIRLVGGFALVDNVLFGKLLQSSPTVSAPGNSVSGLCLNCPISALMSSRQSPPQR